MSRAIKALFAALAIVVLSGCATSLDKTATTVDWSKGSVIAMTVELTNEYKPAYQPTHLGVVVVAGANANQRTMGLGRIYAGKNAYLVTQQVAPGKYNLSRITGMAHKFPIVGGIDFAVQAPFEVAPHSVIYLGRITAVNKEKINKDDQSTGGIIPLIDQAISGFGGGTLEVVLKDNYEEDVKLLKREFIALEKLEVVRSPLKTMKLERTTGSSAALIEVNLATAVVAAQNAPAPAAPVTGK